MKKILSILVASLILLGFTDVSHAAGKPPFKYTNYQSYTTQDGVVKLRKYRYNYEITGVAKGAPNPFVGKKIKSIKKVGASDEQNYWIWQTFLRCGSIDAVFMVEAESGWVLDNINERTSDYSLFQWNYKYHWDKIGKKDFWTYRWQVENGCKLFNQRANVNQITWDDKNKEWRSGESHTWRAMPVIYTQNVLDQFYVEYF